MGSRRTVSISRAAITRRLPTKKWSCCTVVQQLQRKYQLHVEGFHAQDGVAYFAQELKQLLGVLGADGLVCDHVGEVLNTVQFRSDSIRFVCTF